MRIAIRIVAAGAAVAALSIGGPSGAQPAPPARQVPVHAAVAHVDGAPVLDRDRLEAMCARATRIFAAASLAFVLEDVRPLTGAHARLETRADRHALAAEHRRRVVNVFVVASLRDVDDPSRFRMGVHWRPDRSRPELHYVIVSASAFDDVLAHELGHYFGNHRHSDVPGNIMSYTRAEEPFFDPTQLAVIARHVARFVRSGELALASAGAPRVR